MAMPDHLKSSAPRPTLPAVVLPNTAAVEAAQVDEDVVKPHATLIMAPTGSGKTDCLLSYVEAGIEVFIVSTEGNGIQTLIKSARRRKLNMDLIHWRQINPTNMDMEAMIQSADQLNRKSVSDMQKIDSPGILQKSKYRSYLNLLTTIQNFKCQRTGKSYGDVTEWGDDRAFCIDSLTGINLMMTQLQTGNRGTLTLPDYNVCQLSIENLIVTLCSMKCFFTLTAHMEREKDEITGRVSIMASTVGKKLAPKVPIHFSEVIRARREEGKFFWSTEDSEAELKARSLPWSDKITPSFVQIVEAYRSDKAFAEQYKEAKRQETAEATV